MKPDLSKIISSELKDYPLIDEIKNNVKLIVKGVQLNPREIKRFVNSVILAESVFSSRDKSLSIKELIAVQALSFRSGWKNFLDLIAPDESRPIFMRHYRKFREQKKNREITVPTLKDVSERSQKGTEFFQKMSAIYNELFPQASTELTTGDKDDKRNMLRNDIEEFYIEYIKQGEELGTFLDTGADILEKIDEMGKYRRALAATKIKPGLNMELIYSCWRDRDKDKEHQYKRMYQFHVIIDASNVILDQIESVTYRLPSSWGERKAQTIDDRSTNFKLKELAWGSFTLYADVKFREQDNLVTLSHPITLKEESPRLPV